MTKTLLIISGGSEAVPGIKRAKAMGLHVVVSDQDPMAAGFTYADDKIIASTYDVQQTVEAARYYHKTIRPLNGVICMAADVPLTVASVANELGLPGLPVEVARLATDKLAMKQCFRDKGVAIPWFSEVESRQHLRQLIEQQEFKLVLKPVDSRGARGVLQLRDGLDIEWAYEHALSYSPTGRVMVEQYLSGPQVSTETIIGNGHACTVGFIDRNYQFLDRFAPFMIENGGEQPSSLSLSQKTEVISLAEQAAAAMGIREGIAKGDMVLTSSGPKVIEIAARLSGGWMSSDQIPLATGVDIVGAAIRIALGELPELTNILPVNQCGVAIRYFFPKTGRIKSIANIDSLIENPWVHKLQMFLQEGDIVEEVTDHTRRAGFVITKGDNRHEAVMRAEQVINQVSIETVPLS